MMPPVLLLGMTCFIGMYTLVCMLITLIFVLHTLP